MIALEPIANTDRDALQDALTPYIAEIAPDAAPDPAAFTDRQFGPGRHPFWITAPQRIGFALAFTHDDGLHELAEFAIFPDQRRSGAGREAVGLLLARLPGRWRLGVVDREPARRFWAATLTRLPQVTELRDGPALTPAQSHSYTFTAHGGDAR